MSFFGFTQANDLEEERRRYLEGPSNGGGQQEDVAVYTWGEESYDGLGDALQEGGDELNDETFGGGGSVGKDFDFAGTTLPEGVRSHQAPRESTSQIVQPVHHSQSYVVEENHRLQPQAAPSSRQAHSLESIWDDKSPFSVLPRTNGSHRSGEHRATPSQNYSSYGNQVHETHVGQPSAEPLHLGGVHSQGVRTLEEIEAEMRQAAFAAQRNQNISPSQHISQARQTQGRGTPQLQQQQQQRYLQQEVATPPRMHPHAQSPRFHQYHQEQQIQLLEQERLRQLEDSMRQQERIQLMAQMERERERERRREQQLREAQAQQARYLEIQQRQHDRRLAQAQAAAAAGRMTPPMAAELQQRRYGHHSPANNYPTQQQQPADAPFQQSMQYLPRDIQLQQRLLAEMAQAEFMRLNTLQASAAAIAAERGNLPLYSTDDADEEREHQETLRAEAMRKIMEAERMEEKRRRKLEKIRYMSRYNDLMTQSDKDFITRIQVSQLVTQDPYTDDWYAQVFSAHTRLRAGVSGPDTVMKIGNAGGVGLGLSQNKGGARRPSAMQRMEAQVERIVNNARLREKEKTSLNNLQGALGKTAGRSYKAAPRQLLQVDESAASPSPTLSHATAHPHISKADAASHDDNTVGTNAAAEAAKIGRLAVRVLGTPLQVQEPLTPREALVKLERIYDMVLDLEQLKNDPPIPEDIEAVTAWDAQTEEIVENIWNALGILVPMTSAPHPFISLITPIKGKRLLSRVMRYFSNERVMQTITLLVSKFAELDVVLSADLLDTLHDTPEHREAQQQAQAFELSVIQSVFPASASANLKAILGVLGIFLHENDIGTIARTRPGIALLTVFLSRAEVIKQATDPSEMPTQAELNDWQPVFDQLFNSLVPHLPYIFPSVRLAINTGGMPVTEVPDMDVIDHDVWAFLATLSVASNTEQQQILVTSLRERVLENVASATKGWSIPNEEVRKMRLANVNLFLHALGLDSSQIAL